MTKEDTTTENKTSMRGSESKPTDKGATGITYPTEDDQLEAAIALSLRHTNQTDGAVKQEEATSHSKPALVDQIKGVLYGNCIGDAIGLLTEFMDKREAKHVRYSFVFEIKA